MAREQILQEAYNKGFEKGAQAGGYVLPASALGAAAGTAVGAVLPAKSKKQRLLRALAGLGIGGAAGAGVGAFGNYTYGQGESTGSTDAWYNAREHFKPYTDAISAINDRLNNPSADDSVPESLIQALLEFRRRNPKQ